MARWGDHRGQVGDGLVSALRLNRSGPGHGRKLALAGGYRLAFHRCSRFRNYPQPGWGVRIRGHHLNPLVVEGGGLRIGLVELEE